MNIKRNHQKINHRFQVPLMKILILCLILSSYLTTSYADDLTPEEMRIQKLLKLRFDPDYSHEQTKENFLANLSRDCKSFGYNQIHEDERISAMAVLETYPKEIALKYFKDHYKELCYYGFSLVVSYLIGDYQDKLGPIVNEVIGECYRSPKSLPLCQSMGKEFFYTDMARILNLLCTKDANSNFHKLYCEFKQVKRQKCEFYQGNLYKNCPEYQGHIAEIQALLNLFYNSKCSKFAAAKPRCK